MNITIQHFLPGFFLIRSFKNGHMRLQLFASIQSMQHQAFPAIRILGWFKRRGLKSQVLQGRFVLDLCQHGSFTRGFQQQP
jgi:hypothetical protein